MCYAINEKGKTTNNGRNETIKLKIKKNAQRKGNLQMNENIGSGHHQTSGEERKKYLSRARRLLETKLHHRNLITWAVLVVRYSGLFLKWTRKKRQQMDQRTRKPLTIHKALHRRDNVDRLHISRKEGERRLVNIQDSVDTSIQQLEDYKKSAEEN